MLSLFVFTAVACGTDDPSDGKVVIRVGDLITDTSGTNAYVKNRQKQFDDNNPDIKVEHVANPVNKSTETTQQIQQNFDNKSEACTIVQTTAANYSRTLYSSMGITDDWSKYLTEEEGAQYRDDVVASLTSTDGAAYRL